MGKVTRVNGIVVLMFIIISTVANILQSFVNSIYLCIDLLTKTLGGGKEWVAIVLLF